MTSAKQAKSLNSDAALRKPGRAGLIGVYLTFTAVAVRTFTSEFVGALLPRYLAFELIFLALYSAAWRLQGHQKWLYHAYLTLQSAIILTTLSFSPNFDSVILLFILLTYQSGLFFKGTTRTVWTAWFVAATGGSLMLSLGPLRGLATALTGMAGEVVIAGFVIINQEAESAKARGQSLLKELNETHNRLQEYAGRAEELAAVQERDRLATSLRDTVSQIIFSIQLTARSAQLLLGKEPSRVPAEVGRLQAMTAEALGHLRSLISRLLPPQKP
jgi:signal transduction histidine kinase